jgi:hypothetical protein
LRKIVDKTLQKVFVDLAYRGSNFSEKSKIYTTYTNKNLLKEDKLMQKRRNAIEPITSEIDLNLGRIANCLDAAPELLVS